MALATYYVAQLSLHQQIPQLGYVENEIYSAAICLGYINLNHALPSGVVTALLCIFITLPSRCLTVCINIITHRCRGAIVCHCRCHTLSPSCAVVIVAVLPSFVVLLRAISAVGGA